MGEETTVIPLLPLRGILVYPSMVLHLDVGREKSVKALEQAMVDDHHILLSTQKEIEIDEPDEDQIYRMGTVAYIKQMLKLPNGTIRILVEGLHRAQIESYESFDEFIKVEISQAYDLDDHQSETEALMRSVLKQFEQYISLSRRISPETLTSVRDIDEPGRLADIIASHLSLKMKTKQSILETLDVRKRLGIIMDVLSNEKEVLELEKKIGQRVKKSMEKTQKEYYLREQMKAIQKELGDKDGRSAEVVELREKLDAKHVPELVKDKALKELDRYEKMPPTSAESSVIRTYLDWIIQLPWTEVTEDRLDINKASQILNQDHYSLEKPKERVLEYLSVQKLVEKMKGPILCLVGPPGVGKTSLGKSVARSLSRKFVRISLGGVRDEAEIRGHRRTYVGALPGRIIQGMKTAGTINPVFLLDEIDKMAQDFRGDPSSALLEVLDPEQNNTFSDHYLEESYDLSNVMFVTTANTTHTIPRPLLDRMEMIHIPGYTEIEKKQIALKHLLPKQMKDHGLNGNQLQIHDEALEKLIRMYTREAGVRNLERELASICRKAAKMIVAQEKKRVVVTSKILEELLGKPRFRFGLAEVEDQVGMATGLAWTPVGGDTLSIEVTVLAGKGKLTLTGKLGDVMKESAQAAFSYIRSRADQLGVDKEFPEKFDVHIHVPEGAIPKDGPSAGITMATALISALTNKPVFKHIGMTGEITLRGRVLPIGGLKEKALAAHRAGLTKILIPKDNAKDIEEIPESILKDMQILPVGHMDDVLKEALAPIKEKAEQTS